MSQAALGQAPNRVGVVGEEKRRKKKKEEVKCSSSTEPRMKEPFCLQAHFVLHDFGKLEFVPHLSP